MNRLGIMVRDLGASELNWRLVRQANTNAEALDTIFFYDELLPSPTVLLGASMPSVEAWGYDGPVVATTLSTAKKLANLPAASARLFYAWDLEWLRLAAPPYRALREVYGDERLTLVARTAEHASLLEDLWGRTVAAVVPDADIKTLLEIAGVSFDS